MFTIVNTLPMADSCYRKNLFDMELWRKYLEDILPGHSDLFIRDMQDLCGMSDLSYEEDVLPVLNAVVADPDRLRTLEKNFRQVTENLDERVRNLFGRVPDVNILLYLGLCNGAGWVTEIGGKTYILLGIEKILELDWCGVDDLNGLIYHELGHSYHKQFGKCPETQEENPQRGDDFLRQLFSEGIAQFFEAALVGDRNYFHQDTGGWLMWCDIYRQTIKEDFNEDLPFMTAENQCYFGDWVDYNGKSDVGYYLGARFVQWIGKRHLLDEMICFDIEQIRNEWAGYLQTEE